MATPSSVPLPLTGDNVIDAATHGFYWQLDSSRTINWSLADGFLGEFWTSPSTVVTTLKSVFKNISSYADVHFNYVGYYADPETAYFAGSDITISLDGSGFFVSDTSTWAIGFFPDASVGAGLAGDIFLNINSQANSLPSYAPGSAGYALAIHEIGHTLGLKHPFDDGGTGHPTLEQLGIPELDNDWFTVMAYSDDYNYNLRFWDPATPMVMDVLALQYLYGKNNMTNATNTTYTLLPNGMYQTIWDAGGTDVINVSQSSAGWAIELPISQLSALVDTKVGFALPASEASLPSPFTLYWLMGDIENVTGSSFDDTLFGNDLSNSLIGNAGNDLLDGGASNDTLLGGLGQDSVTGGLGNDQITLLVTAGNVDGVDAGDDTDTLVLSGVVPGNHVVVVNLSSSTDQVVSIGGVADALTQINFENLTASGLGSSLNVTGSDGDNSIIGSKGNDSLDGGAGTDTLNGGVGNDTYTVDSAGDVVTEALTAGTDKVFSSIDYTLTANMENLELTGIADLNATGNALANVIIGNSGVNILTGSAGNDTYIVQNDTDSVVENLNAGTDLVQSAAASFTLGANVENLTLTGAAINGTGNALANVITGNSGNNLLSGLAGTDQLDGGDGNDTLVGGLGQDTVNGGLGDDRITLLITAGNVDAIDAGADTDTLVLSGVVPGDHVVVVDLSSSTDQVVSIGGTLDDTLAQINFENLTASGLGSSVTVTGSDGDNSIIGASGNDSIDGGAGNDTLTGGAGADTLDGGTGNDTLIGGTGNDTFLFGLGDGQDLVQDNSGSADKILFDGGINPLDLVISRQANDLRLAIHGSSDQITVQNWYTSSVNRTETIQAGNGQTLLSTEVDQLIQAMAGFTTTTGLSWDAASGGAGDPGQQAQFQGILAANWQ